MSRPRRQPPADGASSAQAEARPLAQPSRSSRTDQAGASRDPASEMVFSEPDYEPLIEFLVEEAIRAWRANNPD
jgi:hypothetical protein